MTTVNPIVLVVDDNEMNRDMLGRRLQRQNCDVVMVDSGAAALEAVITQKIDLILLDIMMPNMSGYEVLERIKGDVATRLIPVIMISAVDDLDSVVRCIEMGAEDYLFKPFNPILLKARITASLSRRQLALSLPADPQALHQKIGSMTDELKSMDTDTLSNDQKATLQRIYGHLNDITRLLK